MAIPKKSENKHQPLVHTGDAARDLLARWGFDPNNVAILPDRHPQYRECARHGRYPISMVDERDAIRYMSPVCPVCAAEQASRRLMESAAIPKRYIDCGFDNYVVDVPGQQTALDVCRDYADHFEEYARKGSCLILCGNPGTGKNHLASAVAHVVLTKGHSVLQVTAYDIIARIRQTWQRGIGNSTELEVIRGFAEVGLLIIDEVGKTFGSDGERVHLFEVIDHRYRDLKPTLILSNENIGGVEKYLGPAAFDRLCQNGGLLLFDWQSHRRGREYKSDTAACLRGEL
ncbi:ATP-binding protein [Acidithiobacillus ferrooxidans]|uniref:ATP-binding protein n=1 Tax=Acidithiobacillus ferrooxidans TaxID=920 RepID=UPI00214B96D4|nr:ATP-binding protein [Acidithiobacillus ferrooxidans]MCR2829081.1 ATP-binding protein [Acidithiobacillus ferrooxidans]